MKLRTCIKCKKFYSPDGQWEIEDPCTCPIQEEKKANFYIQPDIEPYKCMVDGKMITSRSEHRESLKRHGCIEAGNEQKYFMNMDKIQERR